MKNLGILSIIVAAFLLFGCAQPAQQPSSPSYVTTANDAKMEFIPSSVSTTCNTPASNCQISFQIKNVGDKSFIYTVHEPTSSGKYSHKYPEGTTYYTANPDVIMNGGTGGAEGEIAPNQVSETITVNVMLLDEATYIDGTHNYIIPVQIWSHSNEILGESKYSLPLTVTWKVNNCSNSQPNIPCYQ